ncbi:hypothetical protein PMIN04_011985 [Paraphaeosphaeria minitans]
MATSHAVPAAAPKKQPRRSTNRIIPAVPHRFSRPPAARPLTPEDPSPSPAAQRVSDRQPANKSAKPEAAPAPIETPLTPDSRVSPVENRDEEELALGSSPARSGDDRVDGSTDAQGVLTDNQPAGAQIGEDVAATPQPGQPAIAVADRERPKSTLRTALPPEFYPREKPMGHTFAAETAELAAHLPSAHVPAHRPSVSREALVFGGAAQDPPAMPSTPQHLEQGVRAAQLGFARPLPGLAPPHLAPQFYPGHSHHPSEPTTPWPLPPYSMPMPPEAIYANGNEYHPPAYPPASGAFQAPFAAPFSPQGRPVSTNGIAVRSHSQSPSKSQYGEAEPGSNYGEESQNLLYANGFSSAKQVEGYDVVKHISNQFGNPEFTDYVFNIRSPDAMLWSMPVHAVIVSRSPVMFEALRHSAPPPFQTKDTRRLAEVVTDDRFVTPESLNEAVKVLYATPLLSAEAFLYNLSPWDAGHDQGYASNEARKRMGQAISYAAAGRVLQIPEMRACGLRIAKLLLRWDTLDIALHFGFSANQSTMQPKGFGTDNWLLEIYAVPLLDEALDFIAYHFPSDFKFYSIASELRQNPRLPAIVESQLPSHNPRLSRIRFGDAPPEDELKPSPVTQFISSILLSIPLALLDRLFSHPAAANQVGWSGLVRIMQGVIEEREKRRQKVLKSVEKPLDTSISRALLENLYREERVESAPERPSGFKAVAVHASDPSSATSD